MLRPYRTVLTLLLAVGAAVMTGCASAPALKEEAVAKPLPPMVRPERTVGYKVVQLRDGEAGGSEQSRGPDGRGSDVDV